MKKILLAALTILLLPGCASNIVVSNPVPLDQIPNRSSLEQEYIIEVGDTVRVVLHNAEDPSNDTITVFPVRTDGRGSLPIIEKEIMFAGYTPSSVKKILTNEYKMFIRNPVISVNITHFVERRIFVAGEVMDTPELFPYDKDLTVLRAVAATNYHHFRADLEQVVIVRQQGNGEKSLVIVVDLMAVMENRDLSQDIALMPNDVIIVPKTGVAVANDWIEAYTTRMVPFGPGLVTGIVVGSMTD